MLILILYAVLVLSTLALVGVAFVVYRHIRRHLRSSNRHSTAKPTVGES